jgi:hypothetical protein
MDRRQFVSATAALMASPIAVAELDHVPYTPQAYAELRSSGKPLLLDFFAPW